MSGTPSGPSEVPIPEPLGMKMDVDRHRFPFCIVWTPLPLITWFFPFIGHMGICTSSGIIRDFAGPYVVSEDDMAFGWPTRYWRLDPTKAHNGISSWDSGVQEASDIYKERMHNLFCDNCHSHVATALNIMKYGGKQDWNMVKLAVMILLRGRFVNCTGFLKTWLPFLLLTAALILIAIGSTTGF